VFSQKYIGMGLHGDIKKKIKEDWLPDCLIQGTPDLSNASGEPAGVFMEDFTCRVRGARAPTSDGRSSAAQIFQFLIKPAIDAFKSRQAHTYIICFDNQKRVPKEKHKTQSKRDNEKKIEPYPEEWEITDGGIGPQFELIDPNRLMAGRPARTKLCRYFAEKIIEYDQDLFGGTIIFDHFDEGPLIRTQEGHRFMKEHLHQFGEADLALFYWCRVYHDSPVRMFTIDSDTIVISLLYLAFHPTDAHYRKQPIYWHHDPKKEEYFHLQKMHAGVQETLKWKVADFCVACIVCGTDFFEKDWLTADVGVRYVFATIQRLRDDPKMGKVRDHLDWLAEEVYKDKFKNKRTWENPGEDKMKTIKDAFTFNLSYWSRDFMQILPLPPVLAQPNRSPAKRIHNNLKEVEDSSSSSSTSSSVIIKEQEEDVKEMPTQIKKSKLDLPVPVSEKVDKGKREVLDEDEDVKVLPPVRKEKEKKATLYTKVKFLEPKNVPKERKRARLFDLFHNPPAPVNYVSCSCGMGQAPKVLHRHGCACAIKIRDLFNR
jgi:hypothetical protein